MTSGAPQPGDAERDFVVALRPTARCVEPVVALRLLLAFVRWRRRRHLKVVG